jgi:predicted RNA methylase
MKISNDVLDVLSNATTSGNALSLVGQLDRGLYQKANKVIEAAGGKWNRKAQCHLFDGDAADAMDQIILAGEVTVKQDFGYFPTPAVIVDQLIELAELEPEMFVLEPSAGRGAIANKVSKAGYDVDCVELLADNAAHLMGLGHVVSCCDFLTLDPDPSFDRVIMNPPFARQADIHHVNYAMKFLKQGGILVSVMSAGVMFRTNRLTVDFRNMVDSHDGEIIPLPEGSFRDSGTMVNTVIVKMFA